MHNSRGITLEPGKYVVAVSGGVDSVVLLDLLQQTENVELIVAHFDHGMRHSSEDDALFVGQLAKTYRLPYVTERVELGASASEAIARKARYNFLQRVKSQQQAKAIVTAHHQDDVLETAVINIIRGTGWRGLSSLRSTAEVRRPMLHMPKAEILEYAHSHGLKWREDPTNASVQYLRNRVRQTMLPKLSMSERQELLALIVRQSELRQQIDAMVLQSTPDEATTFKRMALITLPKEVSKELLSAAVHHLTGGRVEQHMLHRMWLFAKVARPYKTLQITGKIAISVQKSTVVVHLR